MKYSILQLISLSQSFPSVNLIIFGGSEASLVATELATSKIPVILTSTRPAPDTFEKLDVQTGPPLSRSPAAILLEAGVKLGITLISGGMFWIFLFLWLLLLGENEFISKRFRSFENEGNGTHKDKSFEINISLVPVGDSHIHNTLLEAGWVGKFAGLTDTQSVGLVSWQIEEILGLPSAAGDSSPHDDQARGKEHGDFVVWEGRPLGMGASVVLTVDADEGVVGCWPDVQ